MPPAGKADLINYQGHPIETFDAATSNILASVYLGDWYLVANDLRCSKRPSTAWTIAPRRGQADARARTPISRRCWPRCRPARHADLCAAPQPFFDRVLRPGRRERPDRSTPTSARRPRRSRRSAPPRGSRTARCATPFTASRPAQAGRCRDSADERAAADLGGHAVFFAAGCSSCPASVDLPPDAAAGPRRVRGGLAVVARIWARCSKRTA